jgi:hypothetical protein
MEMRPNQFDEFLKETLKGHQLAPPGKARTAFLNEAGTILRARKPFFRWYYIPLLAVFLTAIIAVFYFSTEPTPATSKIVVSQDNSAVQVVTPPSEPAVNQALSSGTTTSVKTDTKSESISLSATSVGQPVQNNAVIANKPVKNEPVVTDNITSIKPTQKSESKAEPVGNNVIPVNSIPPGEKSAEPVAAPEVAEPSASTVSSATIPVHSDTLYSQTTSSKLEMDSVSGGAITAADKVENKKPAATDTIMASPPAGSKVGNQTPKVKESFFTAGVYYQPEWVFNTYDGNKFFNNFGIEGTYYYGPFSVRTGVGLAILNDVKKIGVEYNDYLGSYNKLDSMSFTFSEQSHNFIPNYYMSSENVWDTVSKLDYPELSMRYTYVRIPLVFGFDFWKKGRFSVGARVGTTLSLLLDSKQLSKDYNPGQNKVVLVYGITPDYTSVNWQVTGGLDASFRFTENLFLEFEPTVKYFYKSVYENPGSTKAPFSAGFRLAIQYKF